MAFKFGNHLSRKAAGMQPPQILLWILRILLRLGGIKQIVGQHGFRASAAIVAALKLEHWDKEMGKFDARKLRRTLDARLRKLESDASAANPSSPLRENTRRLKTLIGLAEADAAILEFAVTIHTNKALDEAGDLLEGLSLGDLINALSVILDLPTAEISRSLGSRGMLGQSGLLTIDHNRMTLRSKMDLIGSAFVNTLATAEADVVTLLKGIVNRAGDGQLSMADFDHATESTEILLPYLRRASEQARQGVNILLYGPPGTGKTELVKALARELGVHLFEVACEDGDGDAVGAEPRLRAYRAAQCFFAQQKAMLLFDEIEDVFNDGDGFFAPSSTAQKRKAWINRSLECNAIPTFWVSNSVRRMDPAFVRRFDMVMELPVPPGRQRQRIVQQACADLLPPEAIARIARSEVVSPAVVSRAAGVVRMIRDDLGSEKAAMAVERLIDRTLEVQGHQSLRKQDANRLPDQYDPEFIAADCDLARIADGLMRSKSGRLCLYGPPGTGKTAFGRWLAERMGIPLVVRRASDIMGMYVGQSEKAIARAFDQAAQEGAVLLIDEVDGFLRDRRGAQRSWEVTLVNEMLTQVESFPGVFIASTNLMEGLDQAALRRFDLKVKFDFLRREQALKLFLRYCGTLGIAASEADDLMRLARLRCLTPGDFAAVYRRIASTADLIAALEGECAVKEQPARGIGFTV